MPARTFTSPADFNAHPADWLEHASLILTSNLPFSGWGCAFGDQAVAAAMIDRIVHYADVLTLKGAR